MEKNIIILIIIISVIFYYCFFRESNVKEEFADTGSLDAEIVNPIKNLSIIAKNIIDANKLTIPTDTDINGKLTINKDIIINNAGANFITLNKGTTLNKDSVHIWLNPNGQLILVGQKADNSDYGWPGIVLDTVGGGISVRGRDIMGELDKINAKLFR